MSESDRLRSVYDAYERDPRRTSRENPRATEALRRERQAVTTEMLESAIAPGALDSVRLLDLGCGYGAELERLAALGLRDAAGIDALADRTAAARRRCPDFDIREGDAGRLPWPDASFDLVTMSTVLSSVLDPELRRAIAGEVARVLAPGGHALVYDLRRSNPRNPNVRAVAASDLAALFPGWEARRRRLTVLPPLTRALGRVGVLPYRSLARIGPLTTHLVTVLEKPPLPTGRRGGGSTSRRPARRWPGDRRRRG